MRKLSVLLAPRGNEGRNVFPSHKTFDLTPPNHFLKIIQYVHLSTALTECVCVCVCGVCVLA